jgi:transposase
LRRPRANAGADTAERAAGGDQGATIDRPRHIAGGRHRLRKTVYMAALSAARHNPVLSAFYKRLRECGKPVRAALTALMRKLIELLNELLKNPSFPLAR